MPFSWMLYYVALVRTDVSVEGIASIIRVTRIGELGTMLAVTSNRITLRRNIAEVVPSWPIFVAVMMKAIRSSETSFRTRATRRNIPEDGILQEMKRLHKFQFVPTFVFINEMGLVPRFPLSAFQKP
jgi:hypothetical protein